MTPVRQTIFVATSANKRGNCMGACMASILELPLGVLIDTTSDEIRDDWYGAIQRWLGDRGLKIVVMRPDDARLAGSYSIGIGPSPRGHFNHAVVCRNGVMVFDPHPSDDGVVRFQRHEMIVPLSFAERTLHAAEAVDGADAAARLSLHKPRLQGSLCDEKRFRSRCLLPALLRRSTSRRTTRLGLAHYFAFLSLIAFFKAGS